MRMKLTEEETKLILRQRELETAHREGWNKAILQLADWMTDQIETGRTTIGTAELAIKLEGMKK